MRFSVLDDGRRQILGFALPGDLCGVSALIRGEPSESIAAVNTVTVSTFTRDALDHAMADHPGLRRAVLWSLGEDHALLSDRLVSVGRRSAIERVARTLLELTLRMGAVHREAGALPLTQPTLADATGLSAVHVNRTLKQLREAKLVSAGGPLVVHDVIGLARQAHVKRGDPLHSLLERWEVGRGRG